LSGATALEVLQDGRILVCEQGGALRVIERGRLLAEPLLTLPVDSNWERGVIGVTIDPAFPAQPHIYVCWVAKDPFPHHRVSRFTADGNSVVAGSEKVLLVGDDQRTMGGKVPAGHQGGALHFGTDGKLYIGIGEQTAGEPSQRLDTLLGKLLRINADGTIPLDNPYVAQTAGKYRAIWARGLRNPFTFAVSRADGTILINDVGGDFEEINVGRAGANYGWPAVEHGPHHRNEFVDPIHWYPQASIAGGDFLPAEFSWPAELRDRYFFADFVHGWINTLDPRRPDSVARFASGLRRPVDLRFGVDGALYVLLRNAWVIDGKFEGGTGSLLQIRLRDAHAG
jgi:glucose/arabinose dehydrogenase